ncbi:MAG: chromosome segregation protein SMC, partial [Leptolyngbyaceae cyanobacterium bins.59]|nr:chromosome segregation protein SMC [Leptolyngbyaceae cyanobacterium bins.59]
TRGRSTVEASVTVTFDLEGFQPPIDSEEETGSDEDLELKTAESGNGNVSENGRLENSHLNGDSNGNSGGDRLVTLKEWTITRKLRVTQQGTYTSNYYMNGNPCTLSELHEQLHRLRVYPEGYNVVLQGDVTGIISMNPRERREIIDELAGVAAFDRKIIQAKEKLDAVKEREDRFHIVEKELIAQRDRLAQDRIKAEKYQKLRSELQAKSQWEAVLVYRNHQHQVEQLRHQLERDDRTGTDLREQLATLATEIQQGTVELEQLNAQVKALGEEEQLALQSTLATREAELRQLQRQEQDLVRAGEGATTQLAQAQQAIGEQMRLLEALNQEQHGLETQDLTRLRQERDEAQRSLDANREAASAIAAASEAWVQQQTHLHHQIDELLKNLEPQRTEEARLRERITQLDRQGQEQAERVESLTQEQLARQADYDRAVVERDRLTQQGQELAQRFTGAEERLQLQQETQKRLLQEQREKQRRLDKLEAQTQAIQESQGTQATRLLLQSGIPGLCGLVAQLGRVEPRYQLALETAAGARLGHLVVEDDGIAAAGIELLKQRKAGRATFLPLNKIQAPRPLSISAAQRRDGFIDLALNLIECDDRYWDVFAFVFGNTVVFETLESARRHLGRFRIVTLDGDLLESSGAMTGGSVDTRYTIHFGTANPTESAEVVGLRDRLREIEQILDRCEQEIERLSGGVKQHSQAMMDLRQQHREQHLRAEQLQAEIQRLHTQIQQAQKLASQYEQERVASQSRLQVLEAELPVQEAQLLQLRQALAELEQSQTHSEWQQIQATIRAAEALLRERDLELRTAEQRLQDLKLQQHRSQEKIQQFQGRIEECRTQQTMQLNQRTAIGTQQSTVQEQISQLRVALAALEQTLGSARQQRDRVERQMRDRVTTQQQLEWQLQKLQETRQARCQELEGLRSQLQAQELELPDPLPEVPETLGMEQLQQDLRSLQKRLQAMEPVNMLALEEYERTQTRLQELTHKLGILDEERTELLLRIENFTTLRQRAFKEAFDAVNQNFQTIFAELSDGDGYLQLDDPEDPFNSGLNLVAHPKGKPVQRLASMSGGEKSLTALSFIFALQRYRPSPFYAFDEVDMFLDGANVERLARMIKKQAQQAQFIVVSLRRPMIESAERTIGVTQARGAYTQVLGIKLQTQSASG